jgi:hypothetical protein
MLGMSRLNASAICNLLASASSSSIALTSRVEGNHHVIKSYVRLGKLDLLVVFKRLGLLLANQKVELTAAIERQKIIRAHHLNHDIFKDLHYRVSLLALEKINEQLKNLEEQSPITDQCTQQFTRTWVLPCKHSIRNFVRTGRRLKITDIHSQWHLDEIIAPASFVEQPMTPRKRLLARLTTELNASLSCGGLIGILSRSPFLSGVMILVNIALPVGKAESATAP